MRQRTKNLLWALAFTVFLTAICLGGTLYCSQPISFSHPSGFYEDPFVLEIDGGGPFEIYYTLDGSEPTADSARYHRGVPIEITDATQNPNCYTARTDISVGYDAELVYTYSEDDPLYPLPEIPEQNVDKCTVIRAAAFFAGQKIQDSILGIYFVGPQSVENSQKMYTVSLVAEPEDLFGFEKGIMVTGKTFAQYAELIKTNDPGHLENWFAPYWWWWPANYRNIGREWERPAAITVFNENQEIEMDQTIGIRIHGGGSRGYALKSIRCYARREYDGLNDFDTDWFGEGIRPSKFLLFSGGDDLCFNLTDYMISTLSQDLRFATMDFIPCALYLNGEFWGVYQICEHYHAKFIADHFGVRENNVIMVKDDELLEGVTNDLNHYTGMKDFITYSDMTDSHNYQRACELIDIDSYIDYYALQIYIARGGDWPSGNFALWRTSNQEKSPCGDGRWRWMLFDVNSGELTVKSELLLENDTLGQVLEEDPMFASLFRNPDFQQKFAERILFIGSTLLTSEKCNAFMDAYFDDALGLLHKTNIRVYNDAREAVLHSQIHHLKQFFAQRYPVVVEFLLRYLTPEAAQGVK